MQCSPAIILWSFKSLLSIAFRRLQSKPPFLSAVASMRCRIIPLYTDCWKECIDTIGIVKSLSRRASGKKNNSGWRLDQQNDESRRLRWGFTEKIAIHDCCCAKSSRLFHFAPFRTGHRNTKYIEAIVQKIRRHFPELLLRPASWGEWAFEADWITVQFVVSLQNLRSCQLWPLFSLSPHFTEYWCV